VVGRIRCSNLSRAAARVGALAEANEIVASRETAEAGRVSFTSPRIIALKGVGCRNSIVKRRQQCRIRG
jgi:hypothetical protein